MTGLSVVRKISHRVVCLAGRHGGGGRSTDGWQDKSRSLFAGRSAADGRKINNFARGAHLRVQPAFFVEPEQNQLLDAHRVRIAEQRWCRTRRRPVKARAARARLRRLAALTGRRRPGSPASKRSRLSVSAIAPVPTDPGATA
jgi:hypothetical protein